MIVLVVLCEEADGSSDDQGITPSKKHGLEKSNNQVPELLDGPRLGRKYCFLSFFLLKMMKGIKWTRRYILYRALHVLKN